MNQIELFLTEITKANLKGLTSKEYIDFISYKKMINELYLKLPEKETDLIEEYNKCLPKEKLLVQVIECENGKNIFSSDLTFWEKFNALRLIPRKKIIEDAARFQEAFSDLNIDLQVLLVEAILNKNV